MADENGEVDETLLDSLIMQVFEEQEDRCGTLTYPLSSQRHALDFVKLLNRKGFPYVMMCQAIDEKQEKFRSWRLGNGNAHIGLVMMKRINHAVQEAMMLPDADADVNIDELTVEDDDDDDVDAEEVFDDVTSDEDEQHEVLTSSSASSPTPAAAATGAEQPPLKEKEKDNDEKPEASDVTRPADDVTAADNDVIKDSASDTADANGQTPTNELHCDTDTGPPTGETAEKSSTDEIPAAAAQKNASSDVSNSVSDGLKNDVTGDAMTSSVSEKAEPEKPAPHAEQTDIIADSSTAETDSSCKEDNKLSTTRSDDVVNIDDVNSQKIHVPSSDKPQATDNEQAPVAAVGDVTVMTENTQQLDNVTSEICHQIDVAASSDVTGADNDVTKKTDDISTDQVYDVTSESRHQVDLPTTSGAAETTEESDKHGACGSDKAEQHTDQNAKSEEEQKPPSTEAADSEPSSAEISGVTGDAVTSEEESRHWVPKVIEVPKYEYEASSKQLDLLSRLAMLKERAAQRKADEPATETAVGDCTQQDPSTDGHSAVLEGAARRASLRRLPSDTGTRSNDAESTSVTSDVIKTGISSDSNSELVASTETEGSKDSAASAGPSSSTSTDVSEGEPKVTSDMKTEDGTAGKFLARPLSGTNSEAGGKHEPGGLAELKTPDSSTAATPRSKTDSTGQEKVAETTRVHIASEDSPKPPVHQLGSSVDQRHSQLSEVMKTSEGSCGDSQPSAVQADDSHAVDVCHKMKQVKPADSIQQSKPDQKAADTDKPELNGVTQDRTSLEPSATEQQDKRATQETTKSETSQSVNLSSRPATAEKAETARVSVNISTSSKVSTDINDKSEVGEVHSAVTDTAKKTESATGTSSTAQYAAVPAVDDKTRTEAASSERKSEIPPAVPTTAEKAASRTNTSTENALLEHAADRDRIESGGPKQTEVESSKRQPEVPSAVTASTITVRATDGASSPSAAAVVTVAGSNKVGDDRPDRAEERPTRKQQPIEVDQNYDSDLDGESADAEAVRGTISEFKLQLVQHDGPGYIYIFKNLLQPASPPTTTTSAAAAATARFKVGASRYPDKRLRQAQLFNPDLKSAASVPVTRRAEALRRVYQLLQQHTLPGSSSSSTAAAAAATGWFSQCTVDHIKQTVEKVARDINAANFSTTKRS